MNYLHQTKKINDVAIDIWEYLHVDDKNVTDYRNMDSRGTVNRFGYNY